MITEMLSSEALVFPAERARVEAIQDSSPTFLGSEAVDWAIENNIVRPGDIVAAEGALSLRCPERCNHCPDGQDEIDARVKAGLISKVEARTSTDIFKQRIDYLHQLGVRHMMFVGGTLDHLPELGSVIRHTLSLPEMQVSWFSDGIPQTNADGTPSNLMRANLEDGWMQCIANHISLDYPYGFASVIPHGEVLPPKKGRGSIAEENPYYSRIFKSQYGVAFSTNCIEAGVRRVVLNITVSPDNLPLVPFLYAQAEELQKYALGTNSPTEVGLTFSPLIWRPHQARGDLIEQSPASAGLQMSDMPLANEIFQEILRNEYQRMQNGGDRLMYNSSGYLSLMADPSLRETTVLQAVPYVNGKPVIFNITPTGEVWCDPMFPGPELSALGGNTFGYLDREPRYEYNPFSRFSDPTRGWFPNIVTT